ncbi:MAG: L,D-transpeptidase family protein [Pseudomonadota bacterium]
MTLRSFCKSFVLIPLLFGLSAGAESRDAPARAALPGEAPVAAAPAFGPELAGLRAALGGRGETEQALREFYEMRGYTPLWAEDGRPGDRARLFLAAVQRADEHALPLARYEPEALAAALAAPWSGASEALFSRTYLRFARDIGSGLLEPRRISRNIRVKPPRPEVPALMEALATAPDPAMQFASLAPGSADYRRLVSHYATLRRAAERGEHWGETVSKGATLREGARSRRVPALRARLAALGDYPPAAGEEASAARDVVVAANDVTTDLPLDTDAPDPRRYDDALVAAVRQFQARHGLNTDGVVGPATLSTLNASLEDRIRQVAVNLERARWNSGRMRGDRVVANLPDFRVEVVRDGSVVFESRVVIGKYKHQTVEFSDEMDHMVVNPTWHVPMSIARNEILPQLRENPGYLEAKNMTLIGADPWMIDWETVTPQSFPGRVRQAPGPGNALGRVKFMFPNDFAIYLHDTPSRRLFRRDRRAYSHGCVRVEKPLELAYALLEGQEADPEAAFSRWLRRGRERYVTLDNKLPVHLIYRTVWIDGSGAAQYRNDVYRRDRLVAKALEKAGVSILTN